MKTRFVCIITAFTLVFSGCSKKSQHSNSTALSVQGISSSPTIAILDETRSDRSNTGESLARLPDDISMRVGRVSIEIDPMIEMMVTIQYLGGYDEKYDEITHIESSYKNDVDRNFLKYKEHDAVKYFREIMSSFNYEKPATACLYLEKDFSVNPEYDDSYFATYNVANMSRLSEVMRKFYVDTNFNDFFEKHKGFYEQLLESYIVMFPEWDMIHALEDYYGKSMKEYNIVLVPLLFYGGYGPEIGEARLYSLLGPKDVEDGILVFGNQGDIMDLVLHEFGHSFISISDFDNQDILRDVKRIEYLMEPIRSEMKSLNYTQWETVYEELVLRAAVLDISVRNTNDFMLEDGLQIEKDQGFRYINDVYAVLQQYSANRDEYITFDSFIPVITDYLSECNKS